ncbi:MAG: alcohol dehydrogenase catalytic domain-containing protein [Candidatus Bathyarchaeia archaeon]
MKAVVYTERKTIGVDDVPEPTSGQNDVLVRFKACSICGTDLHYYRGEAWAVLREAKVSGI